MNVEQKKPWSPISLDELMIVFEGAPFFWCVAGGHAIELAVDKTIRQHSDTDILVLRRDQLALRKHLDDWDCWVADPPGTLIPWPANTSLRNNVHDIWCRRSERWELQVMLDESHGDYWYSRRQPSITSAIESITHTSRDGLRYLAPHIQLFYKAKNPREKDELDFSVVLEAGIEFDHAWLYAAIAEVYGDDHSWLTRLKNIVG